MPFEAAIIPSKRNWDCTNLRPLKKSCLPLDLPSGLQSSPSRVFYSSFSSSSFINYAFLCLTNLLKIQYSSCFPVKESEIVLYCFSGQI